MSIYDNSVPSGEQLNNVNAQSNTLNNTNHHLENQLVNGKSSKIARFTSNEERNQDLKKNQNLKINIKSANQNNYHHNGFLNVNCHSNVDTDSNSPNILTPNSFDESPQLSRKRGTSSEGIMSEFKFSIFKKGY